MTASLKKLSDSQLLENTKIIVAREREILIEVLHHLKEIDSRRLYLEIGYSSLWAYCTKELQYTEASAQRRIEAMRVIKELPILEKKIESGALSIASIAKLQTALRRAKKSPHVEADVPTAHNNLDLLSTHSKLEILEKLENKNQKETDLIIATLLPESVVETETIKVKNSDKIEVKLAMNRELMEKLEKIKQLNSHKHPQLTLVETIELMADFMIAKKDLASVKTRASKTAKNNAPPPPRGGGKSVPRAVKMAVWREAGGNCEYQHKKTGLRCRSRYQLEIEHIKPKAFGGGNNRENLKLFCRAHNRMTAREANLLW